MDLIYMQMKAIKRGIHTGNLGCLKGERAGFTHAQNEMLYNIQKLQRCKPQPELKSITEGELRSGGGEEDRKSHTHSNMQRVTSQQHQNADVKTSAVKDTI